MKKLLLLTLSAFVLNSCAEYEDADSNSNNASSSKITPPTWIQGTWKYEELPSSYEYKLNNNNICMVLAGSENCMKEYIELYNGTTATTNVEQRISDTEYYCKVSVQGASNIFHFQKVSENTIKDVIMSNSVGTVVLMRRQ